LPAHPGREGIHMTKDKKPNKTPNVSKKSYELNFEDIASNILKELDLSDYALFHLTQDIEPQDTES
jgi:hypothetical protein